LIFTHTHTHTHTHTQQGNKEVMTLLRGLFDMLYHCCFLHKAASFDQSHLLFKNLVSCQRKQHFMES